jgi:hypothetical protein
MYDNVRINKLSADTVSSLLQIIITAVFTHIMRRMQAQVLSATGIKGALCCDAVLHIIKFFLAMQNAAAHATNRTRKA